MVAERIVLIVMKVMIALEENGGEPVFPPGIVHAEPKGGRDDFGFEFRLTGNAEGILEAIETQGSFLFADAANGTGRTQNYGIGMA